MSTKHPLQKLFSLMTWGVMAALILTSLAGQFFPEAKLQNIAYWVIAVAIFSPTVLLIANGIRFVRQKSWQSAAAVGGIVLILVASIIIGLS